MRVRQLHGLQQSSDLAAGIRALYTTVATFIQVFQGILMGDSSKIENIPQLLRLWYHENLRVFQDRLVNDEDRDWFSNLLQVYTINQSIIIY